MTDQALNAAVTRLERAVERIERAARTRENARTEIAEAYSVLEGRHTNLRTRVQETIGRLDTLIATGGGDL
jgi:uncharacterized protein (UPF0335 family)